MSHPQNLIIFGDSITYGSWDINGGWVDRLKHYREKLRRKNEKFYLTYNLGIPGETVIGLRSRFKSESKIRLSGSKDENCLIFAYGMNDLIPNSDGGRWVELNEFKNAYSEVLSLAKTLSNNLIVLNITPIVESAKPDSILGRTNREIGLYNKVIETISHELNLILINVNELFLMHEDFNELIDDDGLHPNSLGHKLICTELINKFNN